MGTIGFNKLKRFLYMELLKTRYLIMVILSLRGYKLYSVSQQLEHGFLIKKASENIFSEISICISKNTAHLS